MLEVARVAARAFEEGAEGVIVTHGTDTIEETAYALALMLPRGRPVVLTGAMRNPTLPGTDGPASLLAAARVAASPLATGLGPVVVMNDEVHAARFATKAHTQGVSTIASPGAGPLGDVSEGRVDVLRAAVARRPAGIVVEGTGGGHVMARLLPALDAAVAAGIPVVVASRCAGGASLERTYPRARRGDRPHRPRRRPHRPPRRPQGPAALARGSRARAPDPGALPRPVRPGSSCREPLSRAGACRGLAGP